MRTDHLCLIGHIGVNDADSAEGSKRRPDASNPELEKLRAVVDKFCEVTGRGCRNAPTRREYKSCVLEVLAASLNCGGTSGSCLVTPWLAVGGIAVTLPLGTTTTFTTDNTAGSCNHKACIACGSPVTPCPGTPGAGGSCCEMPGFTAPAVALPALGACLRVDQTACGDGRANSSTPQTGDNDVTRVGDTTDPGTDCSYGTPDDPAELACTTAAAGADTKGKIVRTQGDGAADANGIHYRFRIPLRATLWVDGGGCGTAAHYDAGEALLRQFDLVFEPTTATATAWFGNLPPSGDGCSVAGAGMAGPGGPTSVTGIPQPYGGGGNTQVAAGLRRPVLPPPGHGDRRRRERLRGRQRHPPHPEVHRQRDVPRYLGQAGCRRWPVRRWSLRRGDGHGWKRLHRRGAVRLVPEPCPEVHLSVEGTCVVIGP